MLKFKKIIYSQIIEFLIFILKLPRKLKIIILITLDIISCYFSVWFSYYLRVGEFRELEGPLLIPVYLSIFLILSLFFYNHNYKNISRYINLTYIKSLFFIFLIYSFIFFFIFTIISFVGVPRTLGIIQPIIAFLILIFYRFFLKFFLNFFLKSKNAKFSKNLVIYGAGSLGRQIYNALSQIKEVKILAYIDDDLKLHGERINDLKIISFENFKFLSQNISVSFILFAINNISRNERLKKIKLIQESNIPVRMIPSFFDYMNDAIKISDFKEPSIDELLGRNTVKPNSELLKKNIFSKNVLITGAGGSIGSELCKQIISQRPNLIILLEQNEYNLYKILNLLNAEFNKFKVNIKPILGSVENSNILNFIFNNWRIDTIYHSAAYKHVDLVEKNILIAVSNNILSTFKLATFSIKNKVSDFILISTDKAVRPSSFMGATKRFCEIILKSLSNDKNLQTKFTIVRFGNVLESSGSVIPRFREQIKNGGPITLTDLNIKRYFMTLTEAAQLVIQAGSLSQGGDIFVLEMGEQISIHELAKKMIISSGLTIRDINNPDGDIEIKLIGLKPGEKLYEELIIDEQPVKTIHPKILKTNDEMNISKDIYSYLDRLEIAISKNNLTELIETIKDVVPEYNISSEIYNIITQTKKNL